MRSILISFATLMVAAAAASDAPDRNLPADAAKRLIDYESERDAIQRAADADIKASRDRLVQDLESMQEAYTKAGKLDEALTIRQRVQDLRGSAEKLGKVNSLLVNGSFEDGPEPKRGDCQVNAGSNDIRGWAVMRNQVDLVDSEWQAADGKRCVDLHGSPGISGIQQSFATKKDQRYRVTFSLAGNPGGKVPVKTMEVQAAGQRKEFSFDTSGKTVRNMGWVTKSWDFKAVDSETTIEFYSTMKTDESWGPVIDKISVVAIE